MIQFERVTHRVSVGESCSPCISGKVALRELVGGCSQSISG